MFKTAPGGKFDLISAALKKIHEEIESGELEARRAALRNKREAENSAQSELEITQDG